MANSARSKQNGRPSGTTKGNGASRAAGARPAGGTSSVTRARTATAPTNGTRPNTSVKTATAQGSRLAGMRERSGQAPNQARRTASGRAALKPWYRGAGAIWAALGVILVAIIVFVLVAHGGSTDQYYTPVSSTVFKQITQVEPATLDQINTGGITQQPLVGTAANTPVNKDSSGKPILLYVGAEYCPYCAGQRWSMIIALSRFGTFSNLHNMVSSDSEGDLSSLPTFTFRGATYTSQYLDFQSVEMQDRYQAQLENPSDAQNKIFTTYDGPPYFTAQNSTGAIPFLSYGNQYVSQGAGYQIQVLTDSTREEIASHLNDSTNNVTQSIEGNANYITAAICKMTDNKPANVCVDNPVDASGNPIKDANGKVVTNPIPALVAALPQQK